MLLLGVVTALQGSGGVNTAHLIVVLVQAIGFVTVIAVFGTRLMSRRSSLLDAPISPLSPLTLSLAGCLGLAALASQIGLAAIIGAFLAGMVAAESQQRHVLERQIQPIMALLVPFFFVLTGAEISLAALGSGPILLSLLVITVLAVVGKLAGCWLGALSLGKGSALIVGVGMVPRGEVGIIVASLGKSAGIFSESIYALIIAMSLLTSVIAPPVLTVLLKRVPEPTQDPTMADEEDVSHLTRVDESGHERPARENPFTASRE
jgi:Kef-type K+ transport system membrane component KefB